MVIFFLFAFLLGYSSVVLHMLIKRLWYWRSIAQLPSKMIWYSYILPFIWPVKLITLGPAKFFLYFVFDVSPDDYEKKVFERSSRRKLYNDAVYYIYRTRCREQPKYVIPTGLLGDLPLKQKEDLIIAVIIAWFPHMQGYQVIYELMVSIPVTVDPNELNYEMDELNQIRAPFMSFPDCLQEINSRGLVLPEAIVDSIKTITVEHANELSQRVYYYDWRGLKKLS